MRFRHLLTAAVLGGLVASALPAAAAQVGDALGLGQVNTVNAQTSLEGEVDSSKPQISPNTKTQAQWEKIFDKKEYEEFGCKEEWDKLSEKDLLDIYTYLYEHASDSPNPVSCK